MHSECVDAKVDLLGKFQSAQHACEVLDAAVDEQVRVEGRLLVEAFVANKALKRFLLRVHQKMPFQQAFLGK